MRIGIDGRRAYGSGIGRVTSNLIEGIVAVTPEHEFIIFGGADLSPSSHSHVSYMRVDYPFFSTADLYEFPQLIAENKVDVFISPQFYISPFIKCPSLKMVHDLWPVLHPEWIPEEDEFIAKFGIESWGGLVHFTDHFLLRYKRGLVFPQNRFLSEKIKLCANDVRQLYMIGMMAETLLSATTILIPSLHTFNEIFSTFPEVISKIEFLSNFPAKTFSFNPSVLRKNFVLHVSKWERRKNIENIVRAVELVRTRVRDIQLVLVGDPSYPRYAGELTRFITSGERSAWITHVGIVPDETLASLYRSATALVYPSLYEGFGIPILEAMACGTPVITSNLCSMPEVAGGAALLVDPTSPFDIANAIISLRSSASLNKYLQRKGFEQVRNFPAEAAISTLVEAVRRSASARE
jgi:glycosyltransferase involved in cell wall biosynthesis